MGERFSQRRGYLGVEAEIGIREEAPEELRGVIVTIAYEAGLSAHEARQVVVRLLRRREDPDNWSAFPNVDRETRGHLDACEWFEVYDVIEALHEAVPDHERFDREINDYFGRRGIGWQLVGGSIETRGPEGFEVAVSGARETLLETGRQTAAQEIHEALRDLSRRPLPDLSGSVQHSLAALECVARAVAKEPGATLGAIIKKHQGLVPPPLDTAVEKLWGYASETGRHLREGHPPAREEAELAVHVAAAVAAYLSKKSGDHA